MPDTSTCDMPEGCGVAHGTCGSCGQPLEFCGDQWSGECADCHHAHTEPNG
jgi:hypothetical protein